MSFRSVVRRVAWPALAVALALVLMATFHAYRNPANVAQWLSALALCR